MKLEELHICSTQSEPTCLVPLVLIWDKFVPLTLFTRRSSSCQGPWLLQHSVLIVNIYGESFNHEIQVEEMIKITFLEAHAKPQLTNLDGQLVRFVTVMKIQFIFETYIFTANVIILIGIS